VLETSPSGRFALEAPKEESLVGDLAAGFAYNPTTYGVSLYPYAATWVGDEALWVTGRSTHGAADGPELADVGPRGASLLKIGADSGVLESIHFVHASKDASDIVGLPSSEVTGALVAPDGSAYLVCATERVTDVNLDRYTHQPFLLGGKARKGGVARVVDNSQVEVFAGPDDVPDPRASALDEGGALVVLDAEKGALRITAGKVEPFALPVEPPPGARPLSLWLGKGGDMVAGYDKGAIVSLGGHAAFLGNVGWVWRAAERAPGVLLLGTDEGLVRVRLETQADVPEGKVDPGVLPTFVAIAPVDPGGGGNCLKQGEICQGNVNGCCPGLTCGGGGFVMMCQ
jgi:hypothetical protein